jgi:hypothetical protein
MRKYRHVLYYSEDTVYDIIKSLKGNYCINADWLDLLARDWTILCD